MQAWSREREVEKIKPGKSKAKAKAKAMPSWSGYGTSDEVKSNVQMPTKRLSLYLDRVSLRVHLARWIQDFGAGDPGEVLRAEQLVHLQHTVRALDNEIAALYLSFTSAELAEVATGSRE